MRRGEERPRSNTIMLRAMQEDPGIRAHAQATHDARVAAAARAKAESEALLAFLNALQEQQRAQLSLMQQGLAVTPPQVGAGPVVAVAPGALPGDPSVSDKENITPDSLRGGDDAGGEG